MPDQYGSDFITIVDEDGAEYELSGKNDELLLPDFKELKIN